MEIIGFFIKSITCKREERIALPVNISNKTSIKNVEETEVKAINKKCLKINFEFSSEYSSQRKKQGEIKIEGHVLLLHRNYSKLLENWKKKKSLPEDVNLFVINHVLRRCLVKAISLAEDLGMPSPIPLPVARPAKKGETRYIG